MNICHLFVTPGGGGSEKYALYLSRAAIKEGNKVSFIVHEEGLLTETLKKEGIHFVVIKMPSFYNLESIAELKKYFKKEKVDIAHTHFLREQFLCVAAKKIGAGIKVVRTIHRVDPIANSAYKPVMTLYQTQTDAFIAVSDFAGKFIEKYGVNKKRIYIIPNGVPEITVKGHEKAIGFIGRLVKEKGITEFCRYYKGEWPVIIAGAGPEKKEIENIGNKMVHLIGHVNNLVDFYSKISVLVLPSRIENMPIAILEAYSTGIPVITFDLPALKEIVNAGNGITITFGEYDRMAQEAAKLLEDSVRLARLSESAREFYQKNHTIDHMWTKTKALYQKLLD